MEKDQSTNLQPPTPATSNDIFYRAFARYLPETGPVIILLASCSYGHGQYKIFFTVDQGANTFTLMEQKPTYFDTLPQFYNTCYGTSFPIAEPPAEFVTINDAKGAHRINVESMQAN